KMNQRIMLNILTVDNYFLSKCTKVVDEEDDNVEYVDSCCSEDKCVVGHDKKCMMENKDYQENIIIEDIGEPSFSRNTNKGKGKES
ncbi:2072_t:CDS:1, partial [Gigaspora margarita]